MASTCCLEYENLAPDQAQRLKAACEGKLSEYLARRGDAIWEHRRRSAGYISGTLRYEVLKNAKFRCELCGIPADERALEVDHILPRKWVALTKSPICKHFVSVATR